MKTSKNIGENMTVQELRNNGYKVRVLHNRLYNGYYKWQVGSKPAEGYGYGPIDPDTKGGSTQIIIDSPHGSHYEGLAICSKKENYNKKLGVRIALGRCNVNQTFYNQYSQTKATNGATPLPSDWTAAGIAYRDE